MCDIKLYKSDLNQQIPLLKYISKEYDIQDLQRYFPILLNFYNFKNNYEKKFNILNSKYIIYRLRNQIIDEEYNIFENQNRKYMAEIKKNYKYSKIYKKQIFVKVNSILDPMCYMMGYYNKKNNIYLPHYKKYKLDKYTFNKVNSNNNTAYIDTFSTYLLSQLVEKNICCSFPLFYGSLIGIKKKFFYNITEEYDSLKKTDWFYNGINKNYDVHSILKKKNINNQIDNYESDSEDYPIVNIKCINGDEFTNDPLVFENIYNDYKKKR